MKKIALISALMITMACSNARADIFNGPYAGVELGYSNARETDSSVGKGALAGTNISADFGGSGGVYGLFAGYGKRIGGGYLGAEIEGSLRGARSKFSATSGGITDSFTEKQKYDYGASLRAGYVPDSECSIVCQNRRGQIKIWRF